MVGRTLRQLSHKGLEQQHYLNSAIRIPSSRTRKVAPTPGKADPRITLRFAASYYFLGYLCWGIVLCRLFDFSWLAIILLTILVLFLSLVYHVDTPPDNLGKRD